MARIFFLGTGGGRWSTIFQQRATGGFRIELGQEKIHVDPGPGAIVKCKEYGINPRDTTCVICSHDHLDHTNDAEVMVEAMCMSKGGGIFMGSKSAVQGTDGFEPALDSYHQDLVPEVVTLGDKTVHKLGDCEIRSFLMRHNDPSSVGILFDTKFGQIGYLSDTEYFDQLPKIFQESRILIVNLMRPANFRIRGHMCTEDLIKFLPKVKAEKTILQHFGLKMLKSDPETEAMKIREATKKNCIAAIDGQEIVIDGSQKQLAEY